MHPVSVSVLDYHWYRHFGQYRQWHVKWHTVVWTNTDLLSIRPLGINELQWNFNKNTNIFFQENALQNAVYKMSAIFFQPQCVYYTMARTIKLHSYFQLLWYVALLSSRILTTSMSPLNPYRAATELSRFNYMYQVGQYHGCWCPGSLRRQDISSHDIDYREYIDPPLTWGNVFKYLCQINVEEWHKMQIYVYVPSEKFST